MDMWDKFLPEPNSTIVKKTIQILSKLQYTNEIY